MYPIKAIEEQEKLNCDPEQSSVTYCAKYQKSECPMTCKHSKNRLEEEVTSPNIKSTNVLEESE